MPLQIGMCIDCFMLIAAAVLNQQGTNVVAFFIFYFVLFKFHAEACRAQATS